MIGPFKSKKPYLWSFFSSTGDIVPRFGGRVFSAEITVNKSQRVKEIITAVDKYKYKF
jgi:hypothetical protein